MARVGDLSRWYCSIAFNLISSYTLAPSQTTSGDIMGGSCEAIESLIGGVALFINADAGIVFEFLVNFQIYSHASFIPGDIDPTGATCANMPNYAGAPVIAAAVKSVRDAIQVSHFL